MLGQWAAADGVGRQLAHLRGPYQADGRKRGCARGPVRRGRVNVMLESGLVDPCGSKLLRGARVAERRRARGANQATAKGSF